MQDKFDQLKNAWQEAKQSQPSANSEDMLATIKNNHRLSRSSHLGNVLVLTATLLGLIAFFYYLAPMEDTLSRTGIALMLGGLLLRILIELVSHSKSSQLDYGLESNRSVKQAEDFYSYRQKIHGPVTIIIVCLYTVGFYALSPEFSRYLSATWLWIFNLSYIPIGVVLFFVIRKGIVREMNSLRQLIDLQRSMSES